MEKDHQLRLSEETTSDETVERNGDVYNPSVRSEPPADIVPLSYTIRRNSFAANHTTTPSITHESSSITVNSNYWSINRRK